MKTATNFYFDDLSWQVMKLDEGLFVASSNAKTGIEYDFDNATEFVYDEAMGAYIATVGIAGKQETWVNEVMISTVRGNDAAFKGATLKPIGAVEEDLWLDYTEGSLRKIKLPVAGVWKIYIATDDKQMMFEKIEGEANKEPINFVPNPSLIVVNGQERDFTSSEQPGDEEAGIPAGTGQPWDNQFWIYANRTLDAGEVTVLRFKYKASREARTTTQCHNEPGAYMHWAAIGDVTFTEEWQSFYMTFIVPSEANGMRSIAFNMAEIKEACVYEIKDIEWYLEDETESLIDFEGTKNFFVKEGAGTSPYQFVAGLLGDANCDGAVDVVDVTTVVDFILAKAQPTAEQRLNADVNKDQTIDVVDLTSIVSIILGTYQPANAPAKSPARIHTNDALLLDGTDVALQNSREYVACQMDVTLAEGASLNGVQLTERTAGHHATFRQLSDNTYRILVYSTNNASFTGNEGALFSLNISGKQQASLSNILFSDGNAGYALSLGEATGITRITSNAQQNVYDLSGRQVSKPQQKGVYIMNGKKVVK